MVQSTTSVCIVVLMPDLWDYRKDELYINGLQVRRLTMVGLLAEQVPGIAREKKVGASGVSSEHLPDFLKVSLDGFSREKTVRCDGGDKTLAVEVAKAVRSRLCGGKLELDLVDSVIPVYRGGRKLGEHDMLMECVSGSLRGLLSVELKVRRLWGTERDKAGVREALRKENCDDEKHWWQKVKSGFAGRIIVVAVFTHKRADGNRFELRADLKLNCEDRWRGLFGWPDAGEERIVLAARPKAAAKAVPVPKAVAKAAPKAVARAVAGIAVGERLLDGLVWRDGVVEVKALLVRAGKDATHATYWATRAKEKHGWTGRALYQADREYSTSTRGAKRRKLGGSGAWFATRAVCVRMLKDWGRYG